MQQTDRVAPKAWRRRGSTSWSSSGLSSSHAWLESLSSGGCRFSQRRRRSKSCGWGRPSSRLYSMQPEFELQPFSINEVLYTEGFPTLLLSNTRCSSCAFRRLGLPAVLHAAQKSLEEPGRSGSAACWVSCGQKLIMVLSRLSGKCAKQAAQQAALVDQDRQCWESTTTCLTRRRICSLA